MDKCLTHEEIRTALADIAASGSDSAEHLKYLAAKTLHCNGQPDVLANVSAFLPNIKASNTARNLLADNTKYVLPKIYAHQGSKITLAWEISADIEILLIVAEGQFEMLKVNGGRVSVHRPFVSYTSGSLDESIGKYLPLAKPQEDHTTYENRAAAQSVADKKNKPFGYGKYEPVERFDGLWEVEDSEQVNIAT